MENNPTPVKEENVTEEVQVKPVKSRPRKKNGKKVLKLALMLLLLLAVLFVTNPSLTALLPAEIAAPVTEAMGNLFGDVGDLSTLIQFDWTVVFQLVAQSICPIRSRQASIQPELYLLLLFFRPVVGLCLHVAFGGQIGGVHGACLIVHLEGKEQYQQKEDGDENDCGKDFANPSITVSNGWGAAASCTRNLLSALRAQLPFQLQRGRALGTGGLQPCAALGANSEAIGDRAAAPGAFQVRVTAPHQQINQKSKQRRYQKGDQCPKRRIHAPPFGIPIDIDTNENGHADKKGNENGDGKYEAHGIRYLLCFQNTTANTPVPMVVNTT